MNGGCQEVQVQLDVRGCVKGYRLRVCEGVQVQRVCEECIGSVKVCRE